MRAVIVAGLLLIGACGSDDKPPQSGDFLDQFEGDLTTYEGHTVRVDDEERIVVATDCDVAKAATRPGAKWGPKDGEPGYAHICPS